MAQTREIHMVDAQRIAAHDAIRRTANKNPVGAWNAWDLYFVLENDDYDYY